MKTPRLLPITAAAGLLLAGLNIATSNAAILYVETSNNTIEKITGSGVRSVFATSGVNSPGGLAFDSLGNLYVANGGNNTIEKFTPGGVGSVFASTGPSVPGALAFDSEGNLYVTDYNNKTIARYTPGGVGSIFASTGAATPFGLAFDSAGNLFVSTLTSNTVLKFTIGGVGSVFASDLSGASGLAFDTAGNLYVGSAGGNAISIFTPGGVATVIGTGSPNSAPYGMAFDDAGNLYTRTLRNTIDKRTPGGVWSVFGSNVGLFLAFTDNAGVPLIRPAGPVPEPTTWTMLAFGSAALLSRRRRSAAQP